MRILVFACVLGAILASIPTTHANDPSAAGNKVSKDLINQICNTTPNHSFCLNFLNSIPGSANLSIKELAKVSIETAESKANATIQLTGALLKHAKKNPRLKGQYEECSENFIDSIDNLNEAKAALVSGAPSGMNNYASGALTNVDTCEEDFEGGLPIELEEAIQNLHNIISVILAISNHLNV